VTRTQRTVNILGVAIPFAGFLAAIPLLWNELVGPRDLGILAVGYVLTGLGITVGFHRLLTHRAFDTYRPVRYAFAVLGTMAVQGPVTHWVADHRKHHAYTDVDGDPHSPHTGRGPGVRGALGGLWHAHAGWLFELGERAEPERYARDVLDDRGLRAINRLFEPIVLAGLALPALAGWLIGGTLEAALTAFVWGGLVRIFLLHHVTFAINSLCHFLGRRRFATEDESRNVAWLSVLSFGESWHHNHHAFPRSAQHGLRRWELALDPGGLVIRAMRALGLAWNVVLIPPERQAALTAR
jgi:stearoyl-CoA desaturase (Delta-9 desaturase)